MSEKQRVVSIKTIAVAIWLLTVGIFITSFLADRGASQPVWYIIATTGQSLVYAAIILFVYEFLVKKSMMQVQSQVVAEVTGSEKMGVRVRTMTPSKVIDLITTRGSFIRTIDICGIMSTELLERMSFELPKVINKNAKIRVLTINPRLKNPGLEEDVFSTIVGKARSAIYPTQRLMLKFDNTLEIRQSNAIPLSIVAVDFSIIVNLQSFSYEREPDFKSLVLEVDSTSKSYSTWKNYFESLWGESQPISQERSNGE